MSSPDDDVILPSDEVNDLDDDEDNDNVNDVAYPFQNDHAVLTNDDDIEEDEGNSPSTSSSLLPAATPLDPLLSSSSITVAAPAPSSPNATVAVVSTTPSKPLFQRLWTDEDEIELLQGFLNYTSQRGGATTAGGAPHPDTALFYDQIKSKLQLEFNKNQLVEKLRRLKKKCRNVVNRISSGKVVSFKSPHDRATFEISRKIWSDSVGVGGNFNNSVTNNGNVDENDECVRNHGSVSCNNPNVSPNPSPNPNLILEVKSDEVNRFMMTPVMTLSSGKSGKRSLPQDKNFRASMKVEERSNLNLRGDGNVGMVSNTVTDANNLLNIGLGGSGSSGGNSVTSFGPLIEETVRSCLTPVFREFLGGGVLYGGGGSMGRFGGIEAANSLPFGFGGMVLGMGIGIEDGGFGGDERWRKQQIMELEVYSKRLELVQDQIKATLEDLRSKGL